jgi:dihydropyrimidinase/allantoinase
MKFDTVIKNGQVVLPGYVVNNISIGIKDGKIAAIAEDISTEDAQEIIDAKGLTIFPGGVDCHFHLGIYRPLDEDTISETKSALTGGVTTVLSYFRTGQHYMNKTGSYHDILPEVLETVKGNAYVDYGFHIAPMQSSQVKEMEWMANEMGVTTFKYFMFYKGLNLSASSNNSEALTMSDSYDLGHLYSIMEEAARINKTNNLEPVSVSVHCEDDELIKGFIKRVNNAGLTGLKAYCEARPPLSERVAILKAGTIAATTGATMNLLHMGSADALNTSRDLFKIYPNIKLRREATLHGLGLTYDMLEGKGLGGKVNPPIRTKEDSDALWEGVKNGEIDWIGSDHACTPEALKGEELWPAACGFGGSSLMYPFMISEGYHKRKLPLTKIAELISSNPAKAHAIYPKKGIISVGADADFALVDLNLEKTVTVDILNSAQEYTPFEGMKLKGWPIMTILRGKKAYENGKVIGESEGEYIKRPVNM